MPRKVVSASGSPVMVATMDDISGAGGSVSVADISDATALGKGIMLAIDVPTLLALISALGSSGDQVLNGKLQLNHQLVLKSEQQTTANVLEFYFGPDDGVLDASVKATATADNHGQMALGVRDDTGSVVNAITIDGSSKQIMVLADYKLLVGASGTDISGVTSFGKTLIESTDAATARTAIGAGTSSLAIGTTATTAKAGNYQPALADISDATAFGRQLMQCADAAAAKTLLGI